MNTPQTNTPPHRVILGDSRKMAKIADESIHLIVTSPPYWQLKDYGDPRQIGYHDSYEDYINHLNMVWRECDRVLFPGCRLCINIGDQYARAIHYGRYKVIPIRTEIIKFCEILGFDYMGAVIWQKTATMNTTGGGSVMGSFPYPRNGILKLDYEFILIFKKQGRAPAPEPTAKKDSALTNEEWNRYFCGHWNFPGVRQGKHLAMFPAELPLRLIKMFSFVGDYVLDPFAGSGTTSGVAQQLKRNSVAYEVNPAFVPMILERLGSPGDSLILDDTVPDNKALLATLPYRFKDPHQLKPKESRANATFGSRISNRAPENSGNSPECFSVKEVLSPTSVRLSDGRIIKLLGVTEKQPQRHLAMRFLTAKTKGQKVFLKFEPATTDPVQEPPCYLFLKNKTFINAKLVQQGLATTDTRTNFRYKEKFLRLEAED